MKKRMIKNIISIPGKFYSQESNSSIYSLLKESGYFKTYNTISEEDIAIVLSEYPEYADQWLILSQNKLTGSGWYFKEIENDKYIVGYYSLGGIFKQTEYSDKVTACSIFIKQEIEGIRK